jgi:Transglycosylase SLT domain
MNTNLGVAFAPQISAAAARHNLDPRLLAAVAAQESGGPGQNSGRNIVGDFGHGHGVFQIDDRWHPFASTPAAMDPAQNADYAAGMLAQNLQKYGGDVRAALSAYNAGSPTAPGTQTDWGNGARLGYADSVLRHYADLSGSGSSATAAPIAGLTATGSCPTSGVDVSTLLGLFQQLGAGSATSGGPLQLPQYHSLNKIDENDQRDLAPDAGGSADV